MSSAFHNGPITATPPHESSLQDEIQVQTFTKAQLPSPAESRFTLAGLLSVLDGVDEQNGLLFILTTNDLSSVDSALVRPGRIDAYIEFTRATRQQAEELFNVFYKTYDDEQPEYDLDEVSSWAKTFAACDEECEFSHALLQAFLLEHRLSPVSAVESMPKCVEEQMRPGIFTITTTRQSTSE